MKIVFRVDASVEMGSGHIMRCLTLADELKQQGVDTTFITREHVGHLAETILSKGHKVTLLSAPTQNYQMHEDDVAHAHWLGDHWKQDAEDTRQAIIDSRPDWLVVDHYGIDARWHSALREKVSKILVIDDLADRQLDCDMLIDQTYGREMDAYLNKTPEDCRLFLGSRYAILKPIFSELRFKAIGKRKSFEGIKRILVSMGGMDSENDTVIVLEALAKIKWQHSIKIDVVLGSQAPHLQSVKQWVKESSLRGYSIIRCDRYGETNDRS